MRKRKRIFSNKKTEEQQLIEKAINALIVAMQDKDLRELILIPLTPNGYVPDSWNCDDDDLDFKFEEYDIVEYQNDEIVLTKHIDIDDDRSQLYEIITRLGIYKDQLYYHTTTLTVTNMGDLNISETKRDCWFERWHPITDITDHSKLLALILVCLKNNGMWNFTQKHPECCFLHKSILIMNAPNPIIQLHDSYDYNSISPSGESDIITFINISGQSEDIDILKTSLNIRDQSFAQLKELVMNCQIIAPEIDWSWCNHNTLYGSYTNLSARKSEIFAMQQEDAVELAIYTSGIEIKHLIENLKFMYPKLAIEFAMVNGNKALASDLSKLKDKCACVACSNIQCSFNCVSEDSLNQEKARLISSNDYKYVYGHPFELMPVANKSNIPKE